MTAILLNKKILLAAGVIAAVAAVALGATYAAWQASDDINSNTVSTANLSITAVGAAGGSSYTTTAKPIVETDLLPGWKSPEEARGEITNNSSIPLDLWMYMIPTATSTGACDATKIAWQSSTPNGGNGGWHLGYAPNPVLPPLSVGTIAGAGDLNFTLLGTLGTPVLIATSTNFQPHNVIAVRQVAGFATDASYPENAGHCEWNEMFIGTLPGDLPVI